MRISDWSSDVCSSDLNARMQNPQNALDHPLSSLSIQWQERHDRLPPRVVDQLEFSPRGGDLPDLAARNRAAVQQPRRQVVFASVALVDRKSTRLNSSP